MHGMTFLVDAPSLLELCITCFRMLKQPGLS